MGRDALAILYYTYSIFCGYKCLYFLAQPSNHQVAYLKGFQAIFRPGAVNVDTQMTHSSSLYLRESNKNNLRFFGVENDKVLSSFVHITSPIGLVCKT